MELLGWIYKRVTLKLLFSICAMAQTILLVLYTLSSYFMVRSPSSLCNVDCMRLKNAILLLMAFSLTINIPGMLVTIRISHKLFTQLGVVLPWFSCQVVLATLPVGLMVYILCKGEGLQTDTSTWISAMSICALVIYLSLMLLQHLLLFIIRKNKKSWKWSPDMKVYGMIVNTEDNVVISLVTPSQI